MANIYLANMEEALAAILGNALAWARQHPDPWPRAMARDYLRAETEAQMASTLAAKTRDDLAQARRARHDADYHRRQGRLDRTAAARLAEHLGWTPKTQRDLRDAHKQAQGAVEDAKQAQALADAERQRTAREVEKHRARLQGEWEKAHPAAAVRFRPKPTFPPRPAPTDAPPTGQSTLRRVTPNAPKPPIPRFRR